MLLKGAIVEEVSPAARGTAILIGASNIGSTREREDRRYIRHRSGPFGVYTRREKSKKGSRPEGEEPGRFQKRWGERKIKICRDLEWEPRDKKLYRKKEQEKRRRSGLWQRSGERQRPVTWGRTAGGKSRWRLLRGGSGY